MGGIPGKITDEQWGADVAKSASKVRGTRAWFSAGEDGCGFGTHLICLPFVWQNGVMTALPLLGGNNGIVGGINNRGQIVGVAETPIPDPTCAPPLFLQLEAAIWEKGQVQELPPLPGDPDGFANSINDNGHAVGLSGSCVTAFHAVLWRSGTPMDLGNLGGSRSNIAFDINNRGQVVGQSDLPGDNFVQPLRFDDVPDIPGIEQLPSGAHFSLSDSARRMN